MKSATLETGSFDGEALAAACKALRKAGGVGGLSVSDGVWELAATFLGDGGARVVATRLLPTVRGRLIRLDLVESAAARDVARRLSDEAGLSEVVALADAGVSSEDLARGVALSMAEAIVGATFWEGATYALQAEAVDETTACATGKAALSFEGDAREVLRAVADALEATAGIREERPDLAFRVEVTDAGAEAVERREPLGEGRDRRDRERVLGHLVRARSGPAAPICGRLGLSELEFLRACADLTERGYVAISPAGRAGEPSGSPSLAPIPWQIANAAAALRRRPPAPEQAGRHLARAANLLQAAGATRRAAQLAGEAAVAAPHDLEALVVAVHTAWSTGSRDRAAELSEPLARRLLALGLPARARDVLERAIAHRPAAALRKLLVDVLERQGDDEAMAAVGREWVEGLRDEGRADDARAAAGRLMTVSGGAEREQLLRAAGVDRRKVVALLAVGAVIAGLYGPAKARGEARASYRSAVESAHSSLATSNSLAAATNVLDGLKTQFADLAAKAEQGLVGAPQVAARAREVAERIEAIRTDALAAHALLPHLPWRDAPDFEFLEDQVASLRKRARTDALREPLRALEGDARLPGGRRGGPPPAGAPAPLARGARAGSQHERSVRGHAEAARPVDPPVAIETSPRRRRWSSTGSRSPSGRR